jgi:hypothetical protein
VVTPTLSVLVLTEDNGADAHATITAIVRKMLLLLEPRLDMQRLSFGRADERARAGMGFNFYKSRNPRDRDKQVSLVQAIARHLLIADGPTAVFVHIDGDGPWSRHHPEHLCDNVLRFREKVLEPVQALLTRQGCSQYLEHLALLVPFWSIESWLFQNTRVALELCRQHHPRYARAVPLFTGWQQTPEALDEQERPKDAVAFGSRFNRELAEQEFPAGRLKKLGLSFADSLQRAGTAGLRSLLASLAHPA